MLPTSNAYDFPLLIKHLLTNASRAHARQEIVSHPNTRLSYETFERRVHQLAHSLNNCGIEDAMRVGVMDWDSNRYLECFFCCANDGGNPVYDQCASVACSAALYNQPWRS